MRASAGHGRQARAILPLATRRRRGSRLGGPRSIAAVRAGQPGGHPDVPRRDRLHDGAVLAAAALRRIGFPPLIVELLPWVGHDDDHILAVFKVDGRWGAVAKSNFVGLRYRDPVYSSLRELVMSYF